MTYTIHINWDDGEKDEYDNIVQIVNKDDIICLYFEQDSSLEYDLIESRIIMSKIKSIDIFQYRETKGN